MGDEERERKRKGKQKMLEMDDIGDKTARTSSANSPQQWPRGTVCIRCHNLVEACVCSQLEHRDNPGENAQPSAPAVDNQPHGRPLEQQSGVAPRPEIPQGILMRQWSQLTGLMALKRQQERLQIRDRRVDFALKMAIRDIRLNYPYAHPLGITGVDLTRGTPQRSRGRARLSLEGNAAAQGSPNCPPTTSEECPLCHDSGFVQDAICFCQQFRSMAEAERGAGRPPQEHLMPRANEPFSAIGAQQQQLQHMAELGFGRPPLQTHPMPRAYDPFFMTGAQQQQLQHMAELGFGRPPLQTHPMPPTYDPFFTTGAAQQPQPQHMAQQGAGWPPQAHPEPRAYEQPLSMSGAQQQQQAHPEPLVYDYETLSTTTDAQAQQELRDMPPVGAARGGTPAGGLTAEQLVLPDLNPPPPQVVFNPVVPGSGPNPEDVLCPSCHSTAARTEIQPWIHHCVCDSCLNLGLGLACSVCSSGG